MIKLIGIYNSEKSSKKYDAVFNVNGHAKIVSFGAKGYSDFTLHGDEDRKERYLKRHENREDWKNPLTPGALSRWILWNKPTLKASVLDFRRHFNL